MWISTTALARREHVTTQTIRRWIEGGRYEKLTRTPSGHYRVWVDSAPAITLYVRVSSAKQQSSLETQEKLLRERYPDAPIKRDIASGFNFGRRGFVSLLERALQGEPITLVATTSDRISRSGFPLIRRIFELAGGGILLLEEDEDSGQFDMRYLVAYLTSFCNSHQGKRSGKRHPKGAHIPEE